jgi:tRNA pseudouridine55 synthase
VRSADPFRRGFLFLLDKPAGLTSHDVVERVRKALSLPRVGHSGTLDPMATGLLLLCAGEAARLQSFFTLMDKSYDGFIQLARGRPSGRTATPRESGARRSRLLRTPSAATFSSLRPPIRRRRSAAANSTRWRERARAFP